MKRLIVIIITFFISFNSFSQENDGYGVHLPKFYKQRLHFGFTIAGNSTDFRINPKPNSEFPDTVIGSTRYRIKTIYSQPAPGFAIGIVCDARLHEYVRIRFTPSISFASRKIEYHLSNVARDSTKIFQKLVESAFLLFPLETKIQSKRLGNFSAYVIGGGGYSLDLASRKKSAGVSSGGPNQLDDNVKLKRDDIFYSAGAGTDFYLEYFKLGLELKLLIGTKNLLRPENSIFTNSLDKVRSRMVVFTITFEG
ncbi:MAG: outer membrane beta-barrel protein [Bacteroidetes bacterium]|nr:outer membrane beta-barrel protein [Bacteroidota bacterium]